MRKSDLALVAGVLAAFMQLKAALASDLDPQASPTYDRPAIEIGGGIADDGGSGDINVLMPLMFSEGKDLLFFGADAKFSGFNLNDTDDTVYNVGGYLGYRHAIEGGGVLGLWAGVDTFNTEQSNAFARAIAGIEYFGPHMIARANAFVPLDHTSDISATLEEYVPSGLDAELGLRMAVPMESFLKPGEFRIFAGGYDFIGLDDDGGDVFGGRIRAELDLYPFDEHPDTRLSFDARYAYDKHSGDQYGAGIKLSIPLGVTNKITTHGAKDETVAELDSFGQDLFQPVRRNRDNVSRIRAKNGTTGGTGGVSLSNVCGGASGSLTLNAGLASTTIKQGANLGTIDPTGTATALNLNLAGMVNSNGQTLTQLLASNPQSINTTLTFPASTVNFATQTVTPAAAVQSTSLGTSQRITDVTVTINGNNCSVNVENEDSGPSVLTLATICGGPSVPFTTTMTYDQLSAGPPTIQVSQGALVASTSYNDFSPSTPLNLDIGDMVDSTGTSLTQLLAAQPTTLTTILKFDRASTGVNQFVPNVTGGVFDGLAAQASGGADVDLTLTITNNVCSLAASLTGSAD